MNLSETTTPLAPHLLDLIDTLGQQGVTIMLIGGFGLILRLGYISVNNQQTLISRLPLARATNDFDVMLDLELFADIEKVQLLEHSLNSLGYVAVKNREYFQFHKEIGGDRSIKIDLLTQAPTDEETRFKVSGERVRPKNVSIGLKGNPPPRLPDIHARRTPEAFAIMNTPLLLEVTGQNFQGQQVAGTVKIPHPYAYMFLKLFAFRDWEEDPKKAGPNQRPNARKHARDLYTIVASLGSIENSSLAAMRALYKNEPKAVEAKMIVEQYFMDDSAVGIIRIQENAERLRLEEIQIFLDAIRETFIG